jgi:hypothetical protein
MRTASATHADARGCGEATIAFLDLRQQIDLKRAVDVGSAIGMTAATTPNGSAISVTPESASSRTIPQVRISRIAAQKAARGEAVLRDLAVESAESGFFESHRGETLRRRVTRFDGRVRDAVDARLIDRPVLFEGDPRTPRKGRAPPPSKRDRHPWPDPTRDGVPGNRPAPGGTALELGDRRPAGPASVTEVPEPGGHERQAARVAGGDDFGVPDRNRPG